MLVDGARVRKCWTMNSTSKYTKVAHIASDEAQTAARCARVRRSRGPARGGCAPDPVREAPAREGAHKAAIGIGETGRNASAPANGPAANGSQPPPDPVRVAPVREGAHKAAIDIGDTGRNASVPANGPSANGSQPLSGADCMQHCYEVESRRTS